ncbi:unnamed protein product, partial [Symbiodinium microadriaticum]
LCAWRRAATERAKARFNGLPKTSGVKYRRSSWDRWWSTFNLESMLWECCHPRVA